MPYDLSDTLVVGISATALFDLSEADSVFRGKFESNREEAIEEYREYMAARESDALKPAARYTPAGKVPYRSGSPLRDS